MHVRKWARRAGGRCLGFGLVPGVWAVWAVWAACALWACCGAAGAQLLLSNSRLVYPVGARQVELTMTNDGKRLITAQAWVDAGDVDARPEDTQAPFLVLPPVSKIQPGKSQTLRISYTGAPPSSDRETLYYLNILDIAPPPEKNTGANYMRMNVRSRFKVFFRPAGLAGDPILAAKALVWKISPPDAPAQLVVNNPSPYFLSLAHIRLLRGTEVLQEIQSGLVQPFGSTTLAITEPTISWRDASSLQYEYIDDQGITRSAESYLKDKG